MEANIGGHIGKWCIVSLQLALERFPLVRRFNPSPPTTTAAVVNPWIANCRMDGDSSRERVPPTTATRSSTGVQWFMSLPPMLRSKGGTRVA
jgi:hypothetical protein